MTLFLKLIFLFLFIPSYYTIPLPAFESKVILPFEMEPSPHFLSYLQRTLPQQDFNVNFNINVSTKIQEPPLFIPDPNFRLNIDRIYSHHAYDANFFLKKPKRKHFQTFFSSFISFFPQNSKIDVSTTLLKRSGDLVTVSWNGIQDPTSEDWLGIYFQKTNQSLEYLDFYPVNQSCTYQQGFGNYTFKLLNLRQPQYFRYFKHVGNRVFDLVAESDQVTFEFLHEEPLQIHVELSNDKCYNGNSTNCSAMNVKWLTNLNGTAFVKVGEVSGRYSKLWKAQRKDLNAYSYKARDLCNEPANLDSPGWFHFPGVFHSVDIKGLSPNSRYFYKVGTSIERHHLDTVVLWSEEHSFVTPPLPGSRTNQTFVVYGDMGAPLNKPKSMSTGKRILKEITDHKVDFILHFGDISYANGHGYIWDHFGHFIEPFAAQIPYMVSVGNHEYCYISGGEHDLSVPYSTKGYHPKWGNFENDSGGECAVPTHYRFSAPSSELSNGVYWYKFMYGQVLVIQLSTEHNLSHGSPQFQFLNLTLSSVNRKLTPYVVVTIHRPIYFAADSDGNQRTSIQLRKFLESILLKYDVDIVLAGHQHWYERTCRINQGKCTTNPKEKGIYHVTVGTAGAPIDVEAKYIPRPWSKIWHPTYGFGRISIQMLQNNSSRLLFEFVSAKSGEVKDSVVITNRFT